MGSMIVIFVEMMPERRATIGSPAIFRWVQR
jgi:hypothetical protein